MTVCEKPMLEELDDTFVTVKKDDRGAVANFKCFSPKALHIATIKPCARRGNHVHNEDEIICILGGRNKCEITTEGDASDNKEVIIVEKDLVLYKIQAGIRHSLKNISDSEFYFVCFYDHQNDG